MHDTGDAKELRTMMGTRHGGLVDGGHGADAVTGWSPPLGVEPDHEARTIHQIDHRKVESFGESANRTTFWQASPSTTAVMKGIAGEQQHGAAFQAGEAGNDRAAEIRGHLKDDPLVDDGVDDRTHL